MERTLKISEATVLNAIEQGLDAFSSTEGEVVISHSSELAASGDVRSFFVPAVKLAVDTTLALLEDASISSVPYKEVHDRGNHMAVIAESIGGTLVRTGHLRDLYLGHPELSELPLPEGVVLGLGDKEYVGSLCGAPFTDVAFVGGAALSVLTRNGISGKLEAIKRSRSLLVVSGVQKDFQRDLRTTLGVPYVHRSNLGLVNGDEGYKVEFKKRALGLISGYMGDPSEGRTCPAGRVRSYAGVSLLEEYWPRLIDAVVSSQGEAKRAR